ncbi:hypothetical protein FA15DRAFT_702490 [Coprinopsis marcescibilis]|uniref:Peptidase M43 pregnancy-associated plasma-A domain-containing protein n=1 Tax=Coprinopsis marcescibilis TaxID=230819 RepID=A0A5C3L1Y2_COPMA|nr:hypothetical protein FA15DRAFT_702490 [Coprinopsis marcescibilis]
MRLFLWSLASLVLLLGNVIGQHNGLNSTSAAPSSSDPARDALGFKTECLTPDVAPADAARVEKEFQAIRKNSPSIQRAGLVLPLYYHILYRDLTFDGGYLSDAQVNSAVNMLNDGFSATGISFRLDGIRRWHNATWFQQVDGTPENVDIEREMKQSTRIGGATTLNVWTSGMITAAGYAAFPWNYAANPINDGVVMKWDVLPGNGNTVRSGKTITHEAGHWAGLLHTFQGGCTGDGDFVADTPAQGTATDFNGCAPRDTCPSLPGEDPVFNFMNYSSDECRNHFTWGQIDKMWAAIAAWRL